MNHSEITNYKKRCSSLQSPYKWPTGRSMQIRVKHYNWAERTWLKLCEFEWTDSEQVRSADVCGNGEQPTCSLTVVCATYRVHTEHLAQTSSVVFMVTPCINNIQHFNIQLMHTTLKKTQSY